MRNVPTSLQTILDRDQCEVHTTIELVLSDDSIERFATAGLTINGDVYTDFLSYADGITDTLDSQTDRLEVTLANADKVIGLDVLNGLYDGAQASVRRYFKDLTTGTVEHREIFFGKVVVLGVNEREVKLEIVDAMVASGYMVGNWTLDDTCQLVFKGEDGYCGYTGVETTCNKIWKSKAGCLGRGNTHRMVATPFPFAKLATSPATPDYPLGGWDGGRCFSPETRISMADGTFKPIRFIEEGDLVVAFDERRKFRTGRVKQVFVSPVQKNNVRQVSFDLSGFRVQGSHRILATPEVGLRAPEFRSVKELSEGYFGFYRNERQEAVLNQIRGIRKLDPEEIDFDDVYNFEVEEFHTYIANGVLVSNFKRLDEIDDP